MVLKRIAEAVTDGEKLVLRGVSARKPEDMPLGTTLWDDAFELDDGTEVYVSVLVTPPERSGTK